MASSRARGLAVLILVLLAPVASLRAQVDAEHNHLACFDARGPGGRGARHSVVLESDFGEYPVLVYPPSMMCAPAKKTGGSGSDPGPATEVPDFACHKIIRRGTPTFTVQLQDQFGTGHYTVKTPRLLCAPASDGGPVPTTSTTTSSTTSTTAGSASTVF
jgi:hypothetical protein